MRVAREHGGALLATPLAPDEIVAVLDTDGNVGEIAATETLWRAQTPQGFAAAELLRAYDCARAAASTAPTPLPRTSGSAIASTSCAAVATISS